MQKELTFGDWLKSRLGKRSMGSLARLISVDVSTISHWVANRNRPDPRGSYWPELIKVLATGSEDAVLAFELAGVDLSPCYGALGKDHPPEPSL